MTNPNSFSKAMAAEKFTSIQITSDGTPAGTKVLINGQEFPDLVELNLNIYAYKYSPRISLGLVTQDRTEEDGVLSSRTCWCLIPPELNAKAEASFRQVTDEEAAHWQTGIVVDLKNSPFNNL